MQKLLVGATPCTWNFGSKWPHWCEIADFRFIFARSTSAVTPVWKLSGQSCKAIIGLTIGATMIGGGRPLLPEILDQSDRVWATSLIFARSASAVTPVWKLSGWQCQRQSCKAFIGLIHRAKIIGGGRPLLPEILDQSDRVGAKSPIFDVFSLVATQP